MMHAALVARDLIRQPVSAIDTPALVIDLDAMERNIQRMAAFANAQRIAWRPHAKMHKCAALALHLIAAGANGACVQKTSEAQALAACGVTDIFISNQVIAPQKLRRVAQLAAQLQAQGGNLSLAVDSAEGIDALAQTLQRHALPAPLPVWVAVNIGQNRCGAEPGDATVALARAVARQPALQLAGIHAYQGGAQHIVDAQARQQAMQNAFAQLRQALQALQAAGIAVAHVTGAGTGTLVQEAASGLYTELQPGSFLFMDADYARNQPWPQQPEFEHALFLKTQIISAAPGRAVCDAGHKSHAIDSGMPAVWGGTAINPELEYGNGGDEHGIIRHAAENGPQEKHPEALQEAALQERAAAQSARPAPLLPALGDIVWLVPGHCDPTVNLHDVMIGVRGVLT